MHSLYDSLISILRKEIEVCRELRASLIHEREMLVGASAEAVHESNARKEACILKAGMLEDAREELIGKITALLGLSGRETQLSVLLSHGENGQREEMQECRSTLRSLLTDIQELNQRNKILLDTSLSRVQRSIDFLGQMIYPGATYLSTGRLKGTDLHGKILSREG